jgi:hypothetical protein
MIADRTHRPRWSALVAAAAFGIAFALSSHVASAQSHPGYPYGSEEFRALVTDSYQVTKAAGAMQFPEWFAQAFAEEPTAFPGAQADTLDALLDQQQQLLAGASGAAARAKLEASAASGFHRLVKDLIPRFSLSRGFEFAYVVKYGERQCLLQSALLAALLQRVGVDAGIVMVFRNGERAKSNISHVATLVKLADGTDAIVDASYQQPFLKHTGILVSAPSYRFVQPRYAPHSTRITGYRDERTGWPLAAGKVAPLDYDFVRSQFWFYRGERAPSGILAAQPTAKGLAASRERLERSVALCPGNPIAVYLLGRTYRAEGRRAEASRLLTRARNLYLSYGWLPDGPAQAAGGKG